LKHLDLFPAVQTNLGVEAQRYNIIQEKEWAHKSATLCERNQKDESFVFPDIYLNRVPTKASVNVKYSTLSKERPDNQIDIGLLPSMVGVLPMEKM